MFIYLKSFLLEYVDIMDTSYSIISLYDYLNKRVYIINNINY